MPHLVLETSPGLAEDGRTPEILSRLIGRFAAMPTIDAAAVKARRRVFEEGEFVVGEGHAPGFVHLTLCILEGRPEELRGRISDALWSELRACYADSIAAGAVQTTLELREMARGTYRKEVAQVHGHRH